jgi:AAA domain/PLD-like domain
LCSIALARKVLNASPEMKAKSEPSIGIVTPYHPQAQLLQKLIMDMDAGFQKQIQAGTVHRFQGLEFDVVIFDTVESPGLGKNSSEFISGLKGSRLINVAVTRAKQKLFIVANRTYIQQKMPALSTLRQAMEEAAKVAIVPSLDVVGMSFDSFMEKVRQQKTFVEDTMLTFNSANLEKEVLVLPATKNREEDDIESFTEKTFYRAVKQDIKGAQTSITIASPFLAQERVNDILPLLVEQKRKGVSVKVYTKPIEESEQWSINAGASVKAAGIELLYRPKMHEKLVFIDEKVVYNGSLNLLSHRDTRESVLRVPIPRFVQEELSDFLNSDEEHQKKVFVDDTTLQNLKEIVISVKALPSTTTRCGCGSPLVPKPKHDNSGALYGCSNYPTCSQKDTENISLIHLQQIKALQGQPCPRCESSTSLQLQHWPQRVLLICDAKCGEMQKITFTK